MRFFNYRLQFTLLLLIVPIIFGCQTTEASTDFIFGKKLVNPSNPNIVYHGRINFADTHAPEMYWPGSGFTLWFEGTSIEVVLDDTKGNKYNNYYNAIIDDNISEIKVIQCTEGEVSYKVAASPI